MTDELIMEAVENGDLQRAWVYDKNAISRKDAKAAMFL